MANTHLERDRLLSFCSALGSTRFYDCKGEQSPKSGDAVLFSEQRGEFILMPQFLLRNNSSASVNTERILSLSHCLIGNTHFCVICLFKLERQGENNPKSPGKFRITTEFAPDQNTASKLST